MKKIKTFFVLLAIFAIVFPFLGKAAESEIEEDVDVMVKEMPAVAAPDLYHPPPNDVFGQNQYYSVVFDGEGEAAVGLKLALQNNSKEKIASTVIEIPGTNIRMIRAIQEVYGREDVCHQWNNVCAIEGAYGCIKYENQCGRWGWQWRKWEPKYYTLTPKTEELSGSVKYTFDLEAPLGEQGESAILLYYKAPHYAKKSRGVFNFTFETAKVPYDINDVRVAVNVQEGLYLKGGQAETQYRQDYQKSFEVIDAPMAAGVESQALSDFSNQITYVSGYVKTTSGLDPWESFEIKGKYAESRFALRRGAILGWIFGVLAFLTGLGFLIWFLVRKLGKRKSLVGSKFQIKSNLLPLKIIGMGAGSAISIIIIVILGIILGQLLNRYVYYSYRDLLGIFLFLLVAILALVLLFGPAIYMGIKHGVGKGILVIGVALLTLIILWVLLFIFLSVFLSGGGVIYDRIY